MVNLLGSGMSKLYKVFSKCFILGNVYKCRVWSVTRLWLLLFPLLFQCRFVVVPIVNSLISDVVNDSEPYFMKRVRIFVVAFMRPAKSIRGTRSLQPGFFAKLGNVLRVKLVVCCSSIKVILHSVGAC